MTADALKILPMQVRASTACGNRRAFGEIRDDAETAVLRGDRFLWVGSEGGFWVAYELRFVVDDDAIPCSTE
jgi:hypothetical protein